MLLKLWKYIILLSIPIIFYFFISIYYFHNFINLNKIPSFATYLQYLIISLIISFIITIIFSVFNKKNYLHLFLVCICIFIIGHLLFKGLLIKKWQHEYPNSTFKNPIKTEINLNKILKK